MFLWCTGESAKQADELEVREEEEEKEQSVEGSEKGYEEDSRGCLFLFFLGRGGWKGFGFWVGVCFVLRVGVCCVLACKFWDEGGGLWGGTRVAGGERGPERSRQCFPSACLAFLGHYYGRACSWSVGFVSTSNAEIACGCSSYSKEVT